jgi:hypothetical protein
LENGERREMRHTTGERGVGDLRQRLTIGERERDERKRHKMRRGEITENERHNFQREG